jgi:hypothetical protein
MKRFTVMLLSLSILGLASAQGDKEPTKQEVEAAGKRAEVVADIGMAATLAAYGRGEACEATTPKDFKSPESLVLAGGILLRADKVVGGKMADLDVKPTDEKGKPIEAKVEKSKSLKELANDLFDEARAMVATGGDSARTKAIEEMIKREEKSEPSRGAVGGPQRATRVLMPGETQTYTLKFVGGVPAAVAMTSTGPAKIEFNLSHVGGNSLFTLKGLVAQYNWVPTRDKNGMRMFTVTLRNLGKNPTTYVLTTN